METPKELFDANYIYYRDLGGNPQIPLEARQMIFDLMESYARRKVIETLDNLGKTLVEKVGTDSYQSRCIVYDLKESLKPSNNGD